MKVLRFIFSVVWQLPQFLISLLVLLFLKVAGRITGKVCIDGGAAKHSCVYFYNGKSKNAFSMGELIFVSNAFVDNRRVIRHEYGHAIWSVYLGWFYLVVIGIPSLFVAGVAPNIAGRCYFERWADKAVDSVKIKYVCK